MKKKYFETKPGSLEAAVLEASSLSPKQKKLDLNKNGKIDGSDLAKLRAKKEDMTGDSVLSSIIFCLTLALDCVMMRHNERKKTL
jgi:hypothetical protein